MQKQTRVGKLQAKLLGEDHVVAHVPYQYKDIVKLIKGVHWDRVLKGWVFPIGSLDEFMERFNYNVILSKELEQVFGERERKLDLAKGLKSGTKTPRPHKFLMEHQRVCRDIAKMFDSYGLFLDTGTGKTLTALSIMEEKPLVKWVIFCPKPIIKTAWLEDARDFFPRIKILPLSNNFKKQDYLDMAKEWGVRIKGRDTKAQIMSKMASQAQGYIVNPESYNRTIEFILDQGVQGMIFDESVKLKNHTSKMCKNIIALSDKLEYKYLLSGKPAPNNRLEYFAQMRILDPTTFGTNFYKFRDKFFEPCGYMGYDWRMKGDKVTDFYKHLNLNSITISKEDCLDLPPLTYQKRMLELSGDVAKYYKQMEKERFLAIGDNWASAPNVLASIMKLRQITGGFMIDSEDNTVPIHNTKLNELMLVLEEIGDKPVIIWTNFKNEIATVSNALKAKGKSFVTAYSGTKDVDKSIADFKEGRVQYIIANPQTLKYGATFTHCTYAIYYSLSYSFDDFYQSRDRIYRKGQTKPCTIIFLLCEDTVDEIILHALQNKGKLTDEIRKYATRRKYI